MTAARFDRRLRKLILRDPSHYTMCPRHAPADGVPVICESCRLHLTLIAGFGIYISTRNPTCPPP
jgi:hypothetical protein